MSNMGKEDVSVGEEMSEEEEEYEYESYSSDGEDESPKKNGKLKRSASTSSNSTPGLAQNSHMIRNSSAAYQVISPTSLGAQQQGLISDVSSVLSLPNTKASLLLRHFLWDKEHLFDKYWSNPTAVSEEAGVQFTGSEEERSVASLQKNPVECAICCENKTTDVVALGCKHFFCVDCWMPYLHLKIEEGPQCITTTCPQHGCHEVYFI